MSLQVEIFIEHILNGLTLGALYALVTMGLALVFGVARMVNFAHGDLFMVGGYVFFLLLRPDYVDLTDHITAPEFMNPLFAEIVALVDQIPYPVIVVLVVLIMALFGLLLERFVIHPVLDKSWRVHAIATLGISIVLQNSAQILFTTDPKHTPTPFSRKFVEPLGIRMSMQRIIILVIVVIVFLALQWFIRYTRTGKAIRAVSQNREMCEIVGIDTQRIAMITFGISAGLAGLAAVLIAPLISVRPEMGSLLTLKCLAAVILGGLGRLNGAVYAAFMIGLIEALFGGYVSFAFRDVVSFGIFILILLVRPQGLFGRKVGL